MTRTQVKNEILFQLYNSAFIISSHKHVWKKYHKVSQNYGIPPASMKKNIAGKKTWMGIRKKIKDSHGVPFNPYYVFPQIGMNEFKMPLSLIQKTKRNFAIHCHFWSQKNLRDWRSWETLQLWSDTLLTLLQILHQISVKRLFENRNETRTCHSVW